MEWVLFVFSRFDAFHMSQGPPFCTPQPLLVYSEVFFLGLMHSICPKELKCVTCNPCGYTGKIFFLLMSSICPRDLNSAPYNPCWHTGNLLFLV